RQRARDAMIVLAIIPKIRGCTQFGHENSSMAAYWSIHAALHAGDGALNAILREKRRLGGRTRGQQRRTAAMKLNAKITRLVAHWRAADPLQHQHRPAAAYVHAVTEIPLRTVQHHLRRLKLSRARSA